MNVLFIGGQGNNPDANSVCVRNMALEMIRRGYKVWIIAMGETKALDSSMIGNAVVEYIPEDYYRRLTFRANNNHSNFLWLWFKLLSVLRHFLLLFFYPNTSPIRARQVAFKAEQIVSKEKINVAVCIFTPYDNIYAGVYLKKKFGSAINRVLS